MLDFNSLCDLFDSKKVDQINQYLISSLKDFAIEDIKPNWHPLGFIHATLAQECQGETFRLHIWPVDQEAIDPQQHKIHDHLFDVHSLVLTGAVQSSQFILSNINDPLSSHKVLRVNYTVSGPKIYEDDTRGMLEKTHSSVIESGSSYSVSSQVLHETILYSPSTSVTLVRTSNPINYNPRVILPISALTPAPRPYTPVTKELWLQLLQEHLTGS